MIMLATIFTLIYFNVRKTKESETSILSKIFTNYLHTISAAVSLNFSFPATLRNTLGSLQSFTSSTDTIISFDCFIEDFSLNFFGSSEFIFKTFLSCLFPIFVLSIFAVIFLIWKLVRRSSDLLRNLVVSTITLTYFIHPSLTESTLGLFTCQKVYEERRLRYDLELICWEGVHMNWGLFLGLPMMIIVFGIPIGGIVGLTRFRKHLYKDNFRKYLLILYQGLRPTRYYWEFVNFIRKILLLMILVFIPSQHVFLRIAAGLTFLFLFLRFQMWIRPFRSDCHNLLEEWEIICSVSTLYSAIYFS